MARSLGYAAYRALSRRKSRPSPAMFGPRPDGQVLWLHATSSTRFLALHELAARVRNLRDDLVVLITLDPDQTGPIPGLRDVDISTVQIDRFSSDHPTEIRGFLDHWRPDVCLWAGAALMPNLVSETGERGVPMILIDVNRDDASFRKHRWFPDLTRSSLERFETIMANNPSASSVLKRAGVPAYKITEANPLHFGPSPPPISEDDLSITSQQLTGRPLWLAALTQIDEFDPILAAHRAALRLVHSLLLVISVADQDTVDRLAGFLQSTGLRCARWQIDEEIDDNTQVLLIEDTDDLGLWYRMAPLTFMASSLTIGNTGRSPLEAVALGSAILFGPYVTDHRETYSRLAAVGAARAIGDAEGLGAAVTRLVAPDHAAAMALAGWQVVTEGAELTDRLVELVQDRLDSQEGPGNARP